MRENPFTPRYLSLSELCRRGRSLPLYTSEQSRAIDEAALASKRGDSLLLMRRAAEVLMTFVEAKYERQQLTIFCGGGSNAGDGWLLALLVHRAGWDVEVMSVVPLSALTAEVLQASREAIAAGVDYREGVDESLEIESGVLVDALLGTGLDRPLTGCWLQAVNIINRSSLPVLAVDIPSGLCADTGSPLGVAVIASHTVSFVVLKQGLLTGRARALTGGLFFADLGVDSHPFPSCSDLQPLMSSLPVRSAVAHKGRYGRLLLVGGGAGTVGAIIMAAEAALLSGAGLITVLTSAEAVAPLLARCPEVMPLVVTEAAAESGEFGGDIERSLKQSDAIVIGPGLGCSRWGRALLQRVLRSPLPMVFDADALNLLAAEPELRRDWPTAVILTPHPGEAARLLDSTAVQVEADRYAAVARLQQTYSARVVLKGAGTLMAMQGAITVCPYGNAGMAAGGYGDVLSGVLGSLLAQSMPLDQALVLGVNLHSAAADRLAARQGMVGMRPTELSVEIRQLINSLVS